MAKSFESKLTDASSAETVKAAKQLLKNDGFYHSLYNSQFENCA